jgi:xanthine dehydrogenase/oxidase
MTERRSSSAVPSDASTIGAVKARDALGLFSDVLSFTLNGEQVTLVNPDPATLLVDFLRSPEVGLTGTKLVCGEGGCGACSVVVTRFDPNSGAPEHRPINSCLHPLCALDGAAVTTVEGIGSTRHGLHPVQERIAHRNGSQCGFCTPGWVMSMVGLLSREPTPDHRTIEDYFDGNLCRCTGFRPILDAMQSFASEPVPVPPLPDPPPYAPEPLHFSRGGRGGRGGYDWYRPLELDDVLAILFAHRATDAGVKLVNGNTSVAIYKRCVEDPRLLIDVSLIPALRQLGEQDWGVSIGGGISFTELEEFLGRVVQSRPAAQTEGLRALREHVRRIANVMVRNVGTLAGNLMITRAHVEEGAPFPSDLYTVLAALGAAVTIAPADRTQAALTLPVLDLPAFDELPGGFVVTSIAIPYTREREHVKTYKIARREQNAHALVNAGFRVRFDSGGAVEDAAIVFGGIGRFPVVASRTQSALVREHWTWETCATARELLRSELGKKLVPLPEEGVSEEFRLSLACDLFAKFFVFLALQVDPGIVPPAWRSAGEELERPISFGRTHLTDYTDEYPVGEPIISLSAEIQATGEARYTHDLPSPPGTLHACYVYGERLHASFDYSLAGGLEALVRELRQRFPGAKDYVTAADIPPGGRNLFGPGNDDPVFADGEITAYGQPLGLVLADSLRTAQDAAWWIQANAIAYVELTPTVTTIEEALALPNGQGIFQDEPPYNVHLGGITRPGSDTAWLADPHPEPGKTFVVGQQQTGGQAHFYLETQAALAVPGELRELTLYASSQDLASCQQYVAATLNLPAADVSVQVVRLGGGFGGKETRPPYLAAAAAVAASKTGRPVRLVLDRNTDMAMIGTRHPYRGSYWLSADASGRIEKWRTDFWSNGGSTYDVTFPVSDLVVLTADGAYMVDTFGVNATCCRTNRLTRTAMRSFGVIQCSLVAEDAIEQVAHALDLLPEDVRRANMYADSDKEAVQSTPYGQPLKYAIGQAVWDRLLTEADFQARVQTVAEFNAKNRWRKRGISMIPIKYGISYTYLTGNQGGALLTVCETDGTVVVSTGGVEMGQGLETKLIQIAAEVTGIDMAMFRPAQTSTEVVPNASSTGASTGSDLNGGAVKLAALELRARLEDYCREHEKEFPDWKHHWRELWPKIVASAYADRVNLSAQGLYTSPDLSEVSDQHPSGSPFYYFTWSAACSEVEVDVLTGEFMLLRTDILYDAGKSLNPDLDAGQIWGGFVHGLGNVTTEQMYFAKDGRPISDGTWNYKPPCSKTIPVDFRVTLLNYERTNPHDDLPLDHYGIQSSKSTGEPPLVLANTVFFAIKHAILAARADFGVTGWFELDSPATVARIHQACMIEPVGRP